MIGPDRSPTGIVPDWLANIAALGWRVLVTVALGAVLVSIALLLSTVTAAIVISVIAAAVFAPSVAGLRARGWSRLRAAAVVTTGIVVGAVVLIVVAIVALVPYIPEVVAAFQAGVKDIQADLAVAGLPVTSTEILSSIAQRLDDEVSDAIVAIVEAIATAFSVGILALFTTFFLLLDGNKAWQWVVSFVPAGKDAALTAAGRDALERVGRYFRGAAIVATIDALAAFVLLLVLGVPLAGPLALIVFGLGFIPYFGVLIAAIVLVVATWATSGVTAAAILLAILLGIKMLQGRFLDPMISGRNASIHPALVLVVLPIGAYVGGFFGMFIVIPIVAAFVAVNSAVLAALDPGPAEQRDPIVPGWLDRVAQWSWRLLVAAGVIALGIAVIVSLPLLFLPALFAVLFAATLAPAFSALVRRGQHRTVAALVATGGTFVVIALVTSLALASLARNAGDIAASASSGADIAVGDTSAAGLTDVAAAFSGGIVAIASGALEATVAIVVGVLLVALLCFFFLRDGGEIWAWLMGRLPERPRSELDRAGSEAVSVLSGYMLGTAAISAFGAATQFGIMFLLGLPLALPLAVLSFFGGFIPYIGSLITTGLAFLVTVAEGSPTDIAVMGIFTIVFNIVQGNFVAPLVYGRAVNLHPAIVLLAIPAGSALAGVTGMILVVPLLGVAATTWRTILAAFGSEPTRPIEPTPAQSEPVVPEPGLPEPS